MIKLLRHNEIMEHLNEDAPIYELKGSMETAQVAMDLMDAKKNKETVTYFWNNGDVALKHPRPEMMMNTISLKIDFKKESLFAFPMDDWSDFKKVLRFQQAVKDLIKLKAISPKWEFVIDDPTSTKKTLGGAKVSDLLKYDASYSNKIPFAFHGSSSYYLDDIKKIGLVPNKYISVKLNWDLGYTNLSNDRIYLSMDYDRASYYAQHAVSALKEDGIESYPIVIEIRDLPTNKVVADDDFMTNMGQLNLLQYLYTGKKIDPENYIEGMRSSSQFAYNGRIPAKMIYKIHKIK